MKLRISNQRNHRRFRADRGSCPGYLDGDGNFTQTDNVSINGSPILDRPGSSTCTVSADCTGTQTVNLPSEQMTHTTFVIVGNRKQIFDMGTDPNVVITGVGRLWV